MRCFGCTLRIKYSCSHELLLLLLPLSGGFQVWGESPHNTTAYFWGRSAANIAYKIAQWFGRGGSHMNYYMWFGGNHYGRWAGASITTMYTSDVNLCPDMLRQYAPCPHTHTRSARARAHVIVYTALIPCPCAGVTPPASQSTRT